VIIAQRPVDAAGQVQAPADALRFAEGFDAAIAVLTEASLASRRPRPLAFARRTARVGVPEQRVWLALPDRERDARRQLVLDGAERERAPDRQFARRAISRCSRVRSSRSLAPALVPDAARRVDRRDERPRVGAFGLMMQEAGTVGELA
jgi:hypothetical protein